MCRSLIFGFLFPAVIFVVLLSFMQPRPYDSDTAVSAILLALGDQRPKHYIGTLEMDKVSLGKDIVISGGPWEGDGPKYRVSEHFVCVDCHNILPEAEFADINDPDERLAYSMEYNQPYLLGSTFYGITNRTSWFNGDHGNKYGEELVGPARSDLKEAIQLCSKECSVGRELTEEELDAVLQYFSMMELKLKDLNLTVEELESISAFGQTEEQKATNIRLLKSKYVQGYPATFVDELPQRERKMGEEGNVENGKWIYEKTCLHCHAPNRNITDRTVFGNGKGQTDFGWLARYFKKNNGGSIYWITRHGTESTVDIPQYMPVFSKEKLSDSQIEDLAAYILAESGRN